MRLRKATRGPMFGRETRMVLRHYLERESVPTSAYHRGQSGDPMDAQELLNQREWEQPENWIGGVGVFPGARGTPPSGSREPACGWGPDLSHPRPLARAHTMTNT